MIGDSGDYFLSELGYGQLGLAFSKFLKFDHLFSLKEFQVEQDDLVEFHQVLFGQTGKLPLHVKVFRGKPAEELVGRGEVQPKVKQESPVVSCGYLQLIANWLGSWWDPSGVTLLFSTHSLVFVEKFPEFFILDRTLFDNISVCKEQDIQIFLVVLKREFPGL